MSNAEKQNGENSVQEFTVALLRSLLTKRINYAQQSELESFAKQKSLSGDERLMRACPSASPRVCSPYLIFKHCGCLQHMEEKADKSLWPIK